MKNKFNRLISLKQKNQTQSKNPFSNLILSKETLKYNELPNIYHNLIDIKLNKASYQSIKTNKSITIFEDDKSNIALPENNKRKIFLFISGLFLITALLFGFSTFIKDKTISSNASSQIRIEAARSYFEGYSMGNPDIYNSYFGENGYINDWNVNTIEPINEIEEITNNRKNGLNKISNISYRENLSSDANNTYAVGVTFNPLLVETDQYNSSYKDIYDYMSKNKNKVFKIAQPTTITYNLKKDEKTGKYIINGNRHSALDRVAQANMIIIK
jgi:hypothetical protein